MNKLEILKILRNNQKNRNEWLSCIPNEIQDAFSCNSYVFSYENENNLLIETIFGENSEDVFWFLYEFKNGFSIVDNGIEYVFNDDEEYYKYFSTIIGDEDRKMIKFRTF